MAGAGRAKASSSGSSRKEKAGGRGRRPEVGKGKIRDQRSGVGADLCVSPSMNHLASIASPIQGVLTNIKKSVGCQI